MPIASPTLISVSMKPYRYAFYFSATTKFGRILTGFMICTVILLPGVIVVLGRGYPIWIPCPNAAETASEAKVRNDASFIIKSNEEGRCNGHGRKCK